MGLARITGAGYFLVAKRLLVLMLLPGLFACVDASGGAAELSWTLRTFEGDPIRACDRAGLGFIDLCWRPASIGGEFETCELGRRFKCGDQSGATRFEIDPGPTAIRIFPICADGSVPPRDSYQVPSPIIRTAKAGQILTLDSFLVVVSDRTNPLSQCAQVGCACP
jgi:hypothetical protein